MGPGWFGLACPAHCSWCLTVSVSVFTAGFSAITGIGEVFNAERSDLILPVDVGKSINYILLQIREPKTRLRCARHQVARLDQPQLLRVVECAFSDLRPAEMFWPFSPQTMRNRFKSLLAALDLSGPLDGASKGLDMGSLRAGGASEAVGSTVR